MTRASVKTKCLTNSWRGSLCFCHAAAIICFAWVSFVSPVSAQGKGGTDADGSEKKGVVLTGRLARDIARTGDSIRFWITVENRTTDTLQQVTLSHLDTPGFGAFRPCWGKPYDQTCGLPQDADAICRLPGGAAGSGSDGKLLCAQLAAGRSLTIWGDLPADHPEARHKNFAVLSWQSATGPDALAGVELGETETILSWLSPFVWLRGKPEVTVPAALTLLGLLAARSARKRDERTQMASTMLAETHKASMQYYMPTCSMIAAAVHALDRYIELTAPGQGAEAELRLRIAFYYMTMFQWWHQQTFREVGAYHFRDRIAEGILRALYAKHKALYPLVSDASRRKLDRLLLLVSKQTTLDEFLSLLEYPRTDVQEAWGLFRKWAVTSPDCETDRSVLSAYRHIMGYEVNRPYLAWHGALVPIELSPASRGVVLECQVVDDKKTAKALIEEYLERTKCVLRDTPGERATYWIGKVGRDARRAIGYERELQPSSTTRES
jgi:hypothetical protein